MGLSSLPAASFRACDTLMPGDGSTLHRLSAHRQALGVRPLKNKCLKYSPSWTHACRYMRLGSTPVARQGLRPID